jgi:hypothetical protein
MRETSDRRAVHQVDQSRKEHGAGAILDQSTGSVSSPQLLTLLSLSLVQGGRITHAIVVEFENAEDLAYYSDTDPVSISDVSAFT